MSDSTLEKILWACATLIVCIPLTGFWVHVWHPIPDDVTTALYVTWLAVVLAAVAAFFGRFG